MIIIGECINSTRTSIKEAIAGKEINFLIKEAEDQVSCGASFVDINCAASMEKETEDLIWLIKEVQNKLGCSISIDSPNPDVIKAVLETHKGKAFINSLSAEKSGLELLPYFAKERDSYVVALAIDEKGMPDDIDGRIALADKIIGAASEKGVDNQNIYIDPLVKPVSTEPRQASHFLESVKRLKDKGIKTIGGLSNVSFGLPKRPLLNAVFIELAIEAGIAGLIIDPTSELISDVLEGKEMPEEASALAKDLLLGRDEYAVNYIKAFRESRLNF